MLPQEKFTGFLTAESFDKGLGNEMFRYAAIYGIARKNNMNPYQLIKNGLFIDIDK